VQLLITTTQLSTVYIDTSHLRREGEQFEGKAAIVEKSSSLLFQKIQHSITVQDRQPTSANCILSMVVGPPKANEDPITGLHQMFLGFALMTDKFRPALHDF
ncbi:hypothetical protein H8958_019442, partial [Nasalis larvatus]